MSDFEVKEWAVDCKREGIFEGKIDDGFLDIISE